MPPELRDLLRAQRGALAAAQAAHVGLTEHDLRVLVHHRTLVRVRRGAYVLRQAWDPASAEQRLALRARAILLGRPTAVATRQCALALAGLPLYAVPDDDVHAYDLVSRSRVRSGLHVLPWPPSLRIVEDEGTRRVELAHAIAAVAVASGRVACLVPLDAALHTGRVTVSDVAAQIHLLTPAGTRRSAALSHLEHADPACESVGETRTRLLLTSLGYSVRTQVTLRLPLGSAGATRLRGQRTRHRGVRRCGQVRRRGRHLPADRREAP